MCDHEARQPDGSCKTCEWLDRPFSRFFKRRAPIAPDLFTTPLKWPRYDREQKRWV
jgi:hypothetical protein